MIVIIVDHLHDFNFNSIVIDTESKSLYSLTSSTHLPKSSSSSLSGSTVTSTPTVPPGK